MSTYPPEIIEIYTVASVEPGDDGVTFVTMTEDLPPLRSLSQRFAIEFVSGALAVHKSIAARRRQIMHQVGRTLTVMGVLSSVIPGDTWKYY